MIYSSPQPFTSVIGMLKDNELLSHALSKDEEPRNVADLSKSDRCKIRYLAGWVVFKELGRSSGYIRANEGSKAVKVQKRLQKEKALHLLATELTSTREQVVTCTTATDSIDEIEFSNRGGLTHVGDATYFFFVQMELQCCQYFTNEMIGRYKWDVLKVAKAMVRSNPNIAISWNGLMREVQSTSAIESGKSSNVINVSKFAISITVRLIP